MSKRSLLLAISLCLLLTACASAQTSVSINAPREDDTAVDKDRGIPILVKRCDTAATSASADGKYGVLCMDNQGRLRVVIDNGSATDTDDASIAAGQSSIALVAGLQMYYDGTVWRRTQPSPCSDATLLTTTAISQTASTKIVSATSGKKNFVCALVLVSASTEVVNVVEGTGSTCGTGTAALVGSTTAGNGMSFAANGGVAMLGGNGGVIKGATANVDLCLTQSGSNRVSGFMTWAQQ